MTIILATGGTGGHVFPAITLAKALKVQGHNCILFTDQKTINIESYIFTIVQAKWQQIEVSLFVNV